MKRKNFKSTQIFDDTAKTIHIDEIILPPSETIIKFPKHASSLRSVDFAPYYGKGYDIVVYECQKTIETLLLEYSQSNGKTLTVDSISSYCHGLKIFFSFCQLSTEVLKKDLLISDINRLFIGHFVVFLASKNIQKVTQKNCYTHTKSVLMHLVKKGFLDKTIFPRNPFPSINRQAKGQHPLSKIERESVTLALKKELKRIQSETKLLSSYDLTICVLSIALRTGLNPTSILELNTDCVQPHPIKNNRQLLISHKRRGRNTHIQTIRNSDYKERLKTIMMDVSDIINLINHRNNEIRLNFRITNLLFVFQSTGGNIGAVNLLSNNTLNKCIDLFVINNELQNADNQPLTLNVMRLRKTFENRLWELSGQDPFVTASLAGHTVKVSNDFYLEAPDEAKHNWRFMGELRNKELLSNSSHPLANKENTPIAGCNNSQYGDYAPKDGSHCTKFMSCFRCSSFVVTEDDLYRLFSFYWLLIKERSLIGTKTWNRYYGYIINVINNQIFPHFDRQKVLHELQNAKTTPHPFWRSNEPLKLETE